MSNGNSNELADLKAQFEELRNQIKVQGVSESTSGPGTIVAWYGFTYAIPSGWHLCDGTNGTPDLRGRFILGADSLVGQYGGEAIHTLTIAEMPSHSHYVNGWTNHATGGPGAPGAGPFEGGINTNPAGGNQPHNNMPPYCTLLYIMKL